MLTRRRQLFVSLSTAMLIAPAVMAQYRPSDALQPVDPVIGDTTLLRFSARLLPTDLRQPTNFERVYRVPGSVNGVAPFAPTDDRYSRISGAITAVFPHSEYVQTKKGVAAEIPVNTVYYIGGLPNQNAALPVRDRAANSADNSVSRAIPGSPSAYPMGSTIPIDLRIRPLTDEQLANGYAARPCRPDAPTPPANMLADDQYRKARVRELLLAAAAHSG